MFRRIALLLTAFLMLFVSCGIAEGNAADNPVQTDADYSRAFAEGYVDPHWKDVDPDSQITSVDFREMLIRLISALAPDKLSWFEEKVTDYDTPLTRGEAVTMAWYAAVCVGADNYTDPQYDASQNDPDFWNTEGMPMEDLFPDAFRKNPIQTEKSTWDNEFIASFLWNQWRRSPYSLKMLFPFDEVNVSMHNADPCTAEEAVCAVTRLYDSALDLHYSFDIKAYLDGGTATEEERALLDAADARRAAILGSVNEIEAAGTTYYVSNSGSDKNNGKSPEKAWATLKHAFSRKLKKGDVVLLERGSEWVQPADKDYGLAGDSIQIPEGVTVGAYGEGAKPVIRGDIPDESNDPSFWTLYREQDGVRIWQAARPLRDINVIVLNDGAAWADRIYPCYNGKEYCNEDGSPFLPEDALGKDNTFCCLPNLEGNSTDIHNRILSGPVYLRCDAGNPAEVWNRIIIPQCPSGLSLGENRTAYDLDIRYFTCGGVLMSGPKQIAGTLVNCEVSWCSGMVMEYHFQNSPIGYAYCTGCAIQVTGNHAVVKDCYIHDSAPMAMTLSIHGFEKNVTEYRIENIRLTGNLIERSGPNHWADFSKMEVENGHGVVADYLYEDNMSFFSGMGWITNMIRVCEKTNIPGTFRSATENVMGPADNEGIVLKNNVFFCADYTLVFLADMLWGGQSGRVNAQPIFEGNTYVQPQALPLLVKEDEHRTFYPDDPEVLNVLGDQTGTVIVLR